MKVVLFCHSLASCWNHGNAHFLRGVCRDLVRRGHQVAVFEPANGWSRTNLLRDHGQAASTAWNGTYPELESSLYAPPLPDLDTALEGADLVLVHEWNSPELVRAIGRRRANGAGFILFFHDTHHRAISDPDAIAGLDLDGYDGVLAFGAALREHYLRAGWARRVWVWHEAADTTVFRPRQADSQDADLVWIGNWGDGERSQELRRFIIEPARRLGLTVNVHGVRYPPEAREELQSNGIAFRGWLPNHQVPATFSRHRATVHVPRRYYLERLPGIPTIRVFEALACGIPLVCGPWRDVEQLFPPGAFLVADDADAMTRCLRLLLSEPALCAALIRTGLEAIQKRHSCAHRVDELLAIYRMLSGDVAFVEELRRCA